MCRDQCVQLLRKISSTRVCYGYVTRTIEGKRRGEKMLLPGMDWEWTKNLLEGQYEGEIEEARTCIPGLSDANRPVIGASHGGFRAD